MKKITLSLLLLVGFCAYGQDYSIKQSANTATAVSKKGKFVCKGTLNEVLNKVLGKLPKGGMVKISGRYTDLDFINVPYDNITIEGDGKTSLAAKAALDAHAVKLNTALITADVNNFCLTNIELDGNRAKQTKIDHNASENARLSGVASSGNKTKIIHCYIHDFPREGYYGTLHATDQLISNCRFVNNSWNGVALDQNTRNCKVIGNTVAGSADVSITSYGYNTEITGNRISNCTGKNGATGSGWAIGVEYSPENTTTAARVSLDTITICKVGIYVTKSGGNTVVERNSISKCGIGIALDAVTGVTVTKNVIRTSPVGINLDAANHNVITGNNSDGGITLQAYKNQTVDGNTISRNIFLDGLKINANGHKNIVSNNKFASFKDKGEGTVDINNQ